jgi:gluconolactonase
MVFDRRGALGLLGAAACLPSSALAQGVLGRPQPRSVITDPPRAWGPGADPVIYPDPDILVIDPSFNELLLGITQIRRVWDKGLWLEGPAWSSQGQYLVFSDVQADKQYRYIWETGEVTTFRSPSFNSNGNAFDAQGRQIVCEDLFRRIVRHEHDGTVTVLADSFEGRDSIPPMTSPSMPMAASGSPIRPMAIRCPKGIPILRAGRPMRRGGSIPASGPNWRA